MNTPRNIELGRREREWGAAIEHTPRESCPSGEELLGFVEARLPGETAGLVTRHLAHCPGCRDVVLQLRATDRAWQRQRQSWLTNLFRIPAAAPGARPIALGSAFALGAAALAAVAVLTVVRRPGTPQHRGAAVALNEGRRKPSSGHEKPRVRVASKDHSLLAQVGPPRSAPSSGQPSSPPPVPSTNSPGAPAKPQTGVPTGTTPDTSNPTDNFKGQTGHLYCMVGEHHVYTLTSPDEAQTQRREIEEHYADRIADEQADFQRLLTAGSDPESETKRFNERLAAAAAERDARMASICGNGDAILANHPELRVRVDGPYQVVRVDYHLSGTSRVFDTCEVLPPWPGYATYVSHPYGWSYGHVFRYSDFVSAHRRWYGRVVEPQRRAYYGLVGRTGTVPVEIVRGSRYGGYALGRTSGYGDLRHVATSRPTGYGPAKVARAGVSTTRAESRPPTGYGSHANGVTAERPGDGTRSAPASGSATRPSGAIANRGTESLPADRSAPGAGGYGNRSSETAGRPGTGYGARPRGFGSAPGYGAASPAGRSRTGYGASPNRGYGARPGAGYGRRPNDGGYGARPGADGAPPGSGYGARPGETGTRPGGGYGPAGGYGARPGVTEPRTGEGRSTGGYGPRPGGGYGVRPGGDSGARIGDGYGARTGGGYGARPGETGARAPAGYGRPESRSTSGFGSRPVGRSSGLPANRASASKPAGHRTGRP